MDKRGGVSADEGGEVRGREALVCEQRKQRVVIRAGTKSRREQALRRLRRRIRAANFDRDQGAKGACPGCMCSSELDDVCSTDALIFVCVCPLVAEEGEIVLEPGAFRALHFCGVEQQRAVGPSAGWCDKGGAGGEGARVVKGEADGCASEFGAHTVGAEEGGG